MKIHISVTFVIFVQERENTDGGNYADYDLSEAEAKQRELPSKDLGARGRGGSNSGRARGGSGLASPSGRSRGMSGKGRASRQESSSESDDFKRKR